MPTFGLYGATSFFAHMLTRQGKKVKRIESTEEYIVRVMYKRLMFAELTGGKLC